MARYWYRNHPSLSVNGYTYPHRRTYSVESSTSVPPTWDDDVFDEGFPREHSTNDMETKFYPYADVEVEMPAEIPLAAPKLEQYADDIAPEIHKAVFDYVPEGEVERLSAEQTKTPQMFISRPGVIGFANSDSRIRGSVGKLFGAIFDDLKGQRVIVDDSLSRHSSKLAQRALAAGLIEPNPINPTGAQTNHIDFVRTGLTRPGPTDLQDSGDVEIPKERVDFASRELMRRLSSRPGQRVSTPPSDHKQLKLDGI